ncbi:MAG: PAS domain S-box protein [Ruminococcus sp.]|nr:PAS domain S-box protein [Ruminococcus sp.]
MTSKIFRAIFLASVVTLCAALFVITGFFYNYFSGIQLNQLKDELNLVSAATEQSGINYLEKLSYENYRITWINSKGEVLFDSDAESEYMENHLDREEISEAVENGSGNSVRRSSTLSKKNLYEAVRLSDGTILRMSVTRTSIIAVVIGMLWPLIVVIFISVIISAILAHKMSKRITKPLNNIDLDYPLDNNTYDELAPLLNRIHQQNRRINSKINELKQKTDEFALITESMKEGLVLLDSNKRILSINPAAKNILGAEQKSVGEDFLKIESRTDINIAVERAFGIGHCEIRVRKREFEYQFDISRIENNGKTVGAVLLAFDVTEQANSERMRREFSANVSHELKTPLQTIMGSAELLENGLVKQDDISRFVGHIGKEAGRLLSLVEDIIRLSQLDEDGQMPKEDISLGEIVREVFDVLSKSSAEKNIAFNLVGDNVSILGVRQLFFEIFYNLCDNAVKYNKEKGSVTVDLCETASEIICRISDNGIGIPPEHQPRIFERFYRVDKSHSRKSGGTGLGLSIVKHAVVYHNGTVSLESIVGKGTTVILKFPKQQ